MATPAATPCRAAPYRVVDSTRTDLCTGRDGLIANAAIKSQFTTGTKKSRQTHGDNPASRARLSVIDTPIQRKGSAQTASTIQSHSGAGRRFSVLWENTGFR